MGRVAPHHSSVFFLGRSIFFLVILCLASTVWAQDAIRPSLAGEETAEARRQQIDKIPYNLQLGPMKLRFSATLGFEYNDNVNLSEDASALIPSPFGPVLVKTEKQSDFIIHPQIGINAIWPITELNTFRLDLGLGYAFYLDHSGYDTNTVLVSPGSQLAFDIFVGDFRINFHDRFSVQQDPVAEITLSNVADYGRFENTVGVSVLWDLNAAVATIGYDHYNYISTTSVFDYLNRNAEIVTGSIAFTPNATMSVGIEGAFVDTYYDEHVLNDAISYSAGLFLETQLSNYVRLRIAGGYQNINFDDNGLVGDMHDLSDFYANISLSHRVNAVLTQGISAGHETELGINSNYTTLNYVRYTANWNILYHTLLSTEFFYEQADDSGGVGPLFVAAPGVFLFNPFVAEHIHRFGGALTVAYQLTPHVTLGLRYQYTNKDSDLPLRDYQQNRVSVDGTYSF